MSDPFVTCDSGSDPSVTCDRLVTMALLSTSSGAATPWDAPRMFVTDIVHCDSDISIGCDTPLTIFQKILRVLSSARHFFSVARDTPLTLFQKILRVLSSVSHFFSVARDTPLTLFQKILRVLSSVRHFFSVARDTIIVCKLSLKEGEN